MSYACHLLFLYAFHISVSYFSMLLENVIIFYIHVTNCYCHLIVIAIKNVCIKVYKQSFIHLSLIRLQYTAENAPLNGSKWLYQTKTNERTKKKKQWQLVWLVSMSWTSKPMDAIFFFTIFFPKLISDWLHFELCRTIISFFFP